MMTTKVYSIRLLAISAGLATGLGTLVSGTAIGAVLPDAAAVAGAEPALLPVLAVDDEAARFPARFARNDDDDDGDDEDDHDDDDDDDGDDEDGDGDDEDDDD